MPPLTRIPCLCVPPSPQVRGRREDALRSLQKYRGVQEVDEELRVSAARLLPRLLPLLSELAWRVVCSSPATVAAPSSAAAPAASSPRFPAPAPTQPPPPPTRPAAAGH